LANEPEIQIPLSPKTVVAEGSFGSVNWAVSSMLYDVLPRNTRDGLLDATAERRIQPYFVRLSEALLERAGSTESLSSLKPDWSFETIERTCRFGRFDWLIGEGLWNEIPDDQRATLLEFTGEMIHAFFENDVFTPLAVYARRTFPQH
jgi:hypothetical protein